MFLNFRKCALSSILPFNSFGLGDKTTPTFPAPSNFSRFNCEGTAILVGGAHRKVYVFRWDEQSQTPARSDLIFLEHIEEGVSIIRNREVDSRSKLAAKISSENEFGVLDRIIYREQGLISGFV